jgi:hypothetical protein
MVLSKIEILEPLHNQDKNPIFIVNKDSLMPFEIKRTLEQIARGGSSEIVEFDFDGILYCALIEYINERHVKFEKHENIPIDYLTRIDNAEDQKIVWYFINNINRYNKIRSRTCNQRENEELDYLKERLVNLDKKSII